MMALLCAGVLVSHVSKTAYTTAHILSCHSRKSTRVTLTMALFYSGVPVSHGSVTVSQHQQYHWNLQLEVMSSDTVVPG